MTAPETPEATLAARPAESSGASRRAFLKLAGFSAAVSVLPGCGAADEVIAQPLLEADPHTVPGTARHLATQCSGCEAGCGLLVTVRDGRPIKVEGNDLHPVSQGRTCVVGQAEVLGVYDSHRLAAPQRGDAVTTWAEVDAAVAASLRAAGQPGKRAALVTGPVLGPTTQAAVKRFLARHVGVEHIVTGDPLRLAIAAAHKALTGTPVVPRYRFEHAHSIVSVDADFLGTWLSPVAFTRGYTAARNLEAGQVFCHHTQFEARLSLTGGRADRRVRAHPSHLPHVLAGLAERIAKARGVAVPWGRSAADASLTEDLDAAAQRLLAAPRGRALVVCGLADETAQQMAAFANNLLGADDASLAERTVDLAGGSRDAGSDAAAFQKFRQDLGKGEVGLVVLAGCNPVYELPDGEAFAKELAKAETSLALVDRLDETARAATFACPQPHALSAWGDGMPWADTITVQQPTLTPFGDVRTLAECLAAWTGKPTAMAELMRATWKQDLHPRAVEGTPFAAWWHQALHDGVARLKPDGASLRVEGGASVKAPAAPHGDLAVVVFSKVAVRDARHAHNPWLQEVPDPITKASWGNAASLSPATASRLGVQEGSEIKVRAGKAEVLLPVFVQPGMADNTVAVAEGYGVAGTDRFERAGPDWIEATSTVEAGDTVGVRVAPLRSPGKVEVSATGNSQPLARTQIYDRLNVPKHLAPHGHERRPHVQRASLEAYREDPHAGAPHAHPSVEMWPQDHAYEPYHWGLAIDLSRCTGCASCVVACQAENNIPVVGRDEVARQREMHWLRIDRYFEGEGDDTSLSHQPMMCQQCDHAPCETVCPVLATAHGEGGLNQQVYNRCVGTRYCSNNCPFKVRRFNWFDYRREDERENLVLNPDVTVRTRGVMEKCTFCVQRIQARKADAKREGRNLQDFDIQTACMQACPADAVVFGNMNDPTSAVSKQRRSPRAYRVLEELNVKPSVSYLRQIVDGEVPDQAGHGGAHEKGEHHD